MKFLGNNKNNYKLVISKNEWENIGKTAGWCIDNDICPYCGRQRGLGRGMRREKDICRREEIDMIDADRGRGLGRGRGLRRRRF